MNSDDDNEPRAELFLSPTWVFKVHKRDADLILRALGGRLTEADIEVARELCDRLTMLRAHGTADLNKGAQIAVENMVKARGDRGVPLDPLSVPKKKR